VILPGWNERLFYFCQAEAHKNQAGAGALKRVLYFARPCKNNTGICRRAERVVLFMPGWL
jgi:hypothetical protein